MPDGLPEEPVDKIRVADESHSGACGEVSSQEEDEGRVSRPTPLIGRRTSDRVDDRL